MSGPRARARSAGFSLIELMIALVLGLLLLGAVLLVYLSTKQTFTTQNENSAVDESGRFAIDSIARDLRMAGLNGCGSRNMPGMPVPVRNYLNSTAYPYLLQAPVGGHEGAGTAPGDSVALASTNPAPGGGYAPALPAQIAASAIAGSDALVMAGAEPAARRLVDPFISGANVHVEAGGDFQRGDIALVADCSQVAVFQVTSVNAARTVLAGSAAGGYTPGNNGPISNPGPASNFRDGALVSRARSVYYYVGRPNLAGAGVACTSGGAGTPSLVRATLQPVVGNDRARVMRCEELVRGVESMQVLYGSDSDGDFTIDRYDTASGVADWGEVRAVRVSLLLRAEAPTLPSNDAATYSLAGTVLNPVDDRRQRRVFTSTIALRNRLP